MVPFIPLLLCFPHLLLPKSPRALPFLAFASALKYPIINPEQSQSALPRYPMCPTISHTPGQQPPFSPKMNQIAAPGDSRGDGLHSWMLGLKLSWDGPGRDLDRVSIPQGSVIWVPLLPLCPCAPLGLGRWACGGPVAHGMGLGATGAGYWVTSAIVISVPSLRAQMSFLSLNLPPSIRVCIIFSP